MGNNKNGDEVVETQGEYNVTPPTLSNGDKKSDQLDVHGNKKVVLQDGSVVALSNDIMAEKITVSGNNTYVALAPIGSAQASAVWQVKKIAVSGSDTVITWAGSGLFNQVATDLTALSFA